MNDATQGRIKRLIDYWKDGAREDLATAREVIDATARASAGLFFLHLALEKALKMRVVECTQSDAPYSHSLPSLAQKAQLELTSKRLDVLLKINGYNLSTRYPDQKRQLDRQTTKEQAQAILAEGEELFAWIMRTSST